jgi:hypothetical protein
MTAATIYSDGPTFLAQLGTSVTDNYQSPGYYNAAASENPGTCTSGLGGVCEFSNTAMDAVLGETQYVTTGFANHNLIASPGTPDAAYCAGCNGSFNLIFTSTTVGTSSGVFGAGFDFSLTTYYAYVTFGDGSTANYALPTGGGFWGITSTLDIKSIDIGLTGGGTTTDGDIQFTDLTIGSSVPEPGAGFLTLLGAAALIAKRIRIV